MQSSRAINEGSTPRSLDSLTKKRDTENYKKDEILTPLILKWRIA